MLSNVILFKSMIYFTVQFTLNSELKLSTKWKKLNQQRLVYGYGKWHYSKYVFHTVWPVTLLWSHSQSFVGKWREGLKGLQNNARNMTERRINNMLLTECSHEQHIPTLIRFSILCTRFSHIGQCFTLLH